MPGKGSNGFDPVDAASVRAFAAFFVSAGVVNAAIVALLLCRLPDARVPSPPALLFRAALYVVLGAAAGVAGAFFYWRSASNPYRLSAPISFRLFALICAAGWVWVPAAMLLSTQNSPATVLIGVVCGVILGAGLRRGIAAPETEAGTLRPEDRDLFAASLQSFPREAQGYLIAGCICAAGYAQYDGSHLLAGAWAASAAFLFAWNWNQPGNEGDLGRVRLRARRRLMWTAVLAVLITAWAMVLGVAHRNGAGDGAFAAANADGSRGRTQPGPRGEPVAGLGGFESVILWPFPPKKQIIPPIPKPNNYLGLARSRPMIIRFDGAYWYFQPPETAPGRTAHQAHGTPLGMEIRSNNSFPLMMEAHERLVGPVRLSRCNELDVEIENRGAMPGTLSVSVLLGDSESPGKATVYLGEKPVEASLRANLPAFETFRFAIPARAQLRKFDEITVVLTPDWEHSLVGPKIAIRQFELFPR